MIHRRSLLAGILASGFAPAFGKAGILMPVTTLKAAPFTFWMDGVHDDSDLLLAQWKDGQRCYLPDGSASTTDNTYWVQWKKMNLETFVCPCPGGLVVLGTRDAGLTRHFNNNLPYASQFQHYRTNQGT